MFYTLGMVTLTDAIHPSIEYFAGHFDGEGCIYMRARPHSNRARISITITAVYQPVLQEYKLRFGGQITKSSVSVNKQLWRWQLSSMPEIKVFLIEIAPFLFEKREQAEIALSYLEQRLAYSLRGGNGRGKRNQVSIMLDALSQSTLQSLHQSKYSQPNFSPTLVGAG